MNKRRFFVFTVFLFLLFVFAFGSGCGGGGVSDLGNNDGNNQGNQDNTNNDSPASPVSSLVEYAASHISIGYQNGDNSGYVTKNLTLPTNVDNVENVTITWTSSNPSAISTSGNVNRQTSDTQVTMTANVSDGSETKERTFALKVIRARSRSVEQAKSEIRINGVDEIRLMNVSNDDFQITYSASRDRVTDIDGKYSDIVVTNADDALDSIQSVRGILGLNDPYTELENDVVTSDTYGGEYTFSQVHNGVKVFGRNITASANSAGETDFVASSVVPSATLTNSDLNFSYTQDQAETTAKGHYSGSFDIRSDKTEKIIFTLESYDNNPAPAYIVNVYGTDNEGKYVDENLFVNARNGEVIYSSSNIHDYSVTAEDELDETVTFNLEETLQSDGSTVYVMHDPESRVWIYNNNYGLSNLVSKPAGSTWNDKQQISTYLNMIKIIKWWKNTLNRDSLDGNSMDVDVITHERVYNYRDNAYWWGWTKKIYICDPRSNSRSYAVAPEVINHEATHAVMMYRVGSDFSNNYNNAPGAINEGYADIFGCLQANHWLIGLHVFANNAYTRNISDPADPNSRQNINTRITAPTTLSERYTGTQDNGGVHINSSLISYPAYKMRSFGMSWEDLAKVWYKSMRMGYSASSNYH
ncbi:MAG: M4 family metallopeptidase, partial [Synergistaceae bacterium]|nr:M4 family metallopeptidase [Synergistaceae bacterium]